jgi:Holliday junction resolvase RusA-like endonuclease
MTIHQLWIPGPMPGLNEIIDAKGVVSKTRGRGGKRWDGYSDLKSQWSQRVTLYARQASFGRIVGMNEFFYEIREPNRRRDPSNFVAGAVKITEDALQEAGLLENDGWKQVAGIHTTWTVDEKRPGVMLTVREVQNGGRSEEI